MKRITSNTAGFNDFLQETDAKVLNICSKIYSRVCKSQSRPKFKVEVNVNFTLLHLLKATPVHHVKFLETF